MRKSQRKAMMGIGTLIIFIATILVAAVAAGVLISTSGVLQQRALITGQESRKKITNAVELISITARGNRTDEKLNDFETLIRLDAGSDPLQMKRFDLSFIGETTDAAASLEHPGLNDPEVNPDAYNYQLGVDLANRVWTNLMDLDNDGIMDTVMIFNFHNSTDFLVFNMSTAGYYMYNLSVDLRTAAVTPVPIDITDEPIIGQDGYYYGFFHIAGISSINDGLNVAGVQFNITPNPIEECSFYTVSPETKYCYNIMHGDDDLVLGDGEVFELMYKMRYWVVPETNLTDNADGSVFLTIPASSIDDRLTIQEEFRFIYSSEKGRLTQAQARTPDVIQTTKVPLWPVG
jgi:archaellin